jgi:hypothetical protein
VGAALRGADVVGDTDVATGADVLADPDEGTGADVVAEVGVDAELGEDAELGGGEIDDELPDRGGTDGDAGLGPGAAGGAVPVPAGGAVPGVGAGVGVAPAGLPGVRR